MLQAISEGTTESHKETQKNTWIQLSAVFNACCLTRATNIISGPTHPAHHIFKFLLSVGDSESNNQAEKQLLSERTETAKWLKVLFVEPILYTHTHTYVFLCYNT